MEARYLKKDKNGKVIETPDEMLDRVARHISLAEKSNQKKKKYYNEFLDILDSLEFLPNSPTLMNSGKENGQLSACFVLPVEDDMSAIFEAVKQVALIHKTGGGTGIILSYLRPADSIVDSTKGVASGPVSFMKVFDVATEIVKQGGVRRGANMGVMRINHPDIFTFIACKEDGNRFQNFNISVAATDGFLKSVKNGNKFPLFHRVIKQPKYVKARDLFDTLCYQAWLTGEPGIVFIDEVNRHNPTPWLGKIEGTNPCGEQPLLAWESCNLGSINLTKFVNDGKISWDRLKEVVVIAVRFLDNVIDRNKYPKVKIANKTKMTRKIGLGVMGWADMLIQLKIPYNDTKAFILAEEVMKFINGSAYEASEELGKERGNCDNRIKRRNSTLTTIAPTGTISILSDCSSGIEPIFGKDFKKRVLDNVVLDMGSKYKKVPNNLLITAHDISVEDHIRMQASFQKYVDNAVSKTVNIPQESTVDDVKKAIWLAWELKCKGVTVYREGTRHGPIELSPEGLSECDDERCNI